MSASDAWRERRVFVTGDSGFVGGWLCHALLRRGARVFGYSLTEPAPLSLAATLTHAAAHPSRRADVRHVGALRAAIAEADPEVVIHLAAQPLVRLAFNDPLGTFETNAIGTANLLEAARTAKHLSAVVVFTTDKVYANTETGRCFVETDPLGGDEPYAASKAAAEMAVATWSSRYFAPRGIGVAAVRAGNIIGGGDWAVDRVVPDAIRNFRAGKTLVLRRPQAVRPWQHVLEPVAGILTIAEALMRDPPAASRGWNLGPRPEDCIPVGDLAARVARSWGPQARWHAGGDGAVPEAGLLRLDSTAACERLGWRPRWRIDAAVERTVAWYRAAVDGADPVALADADSTAHLGAAA